MGEWDWVLNDRAEGAGLSKGERVGCYKVELE